MTTLDPDLVLARYDAVAALVDDVNHRPPSDSAAAERAGPVIMREARLLDSQRYDEWLDQWTDDAVFWVPVSVPTHPGSDQSLLLDDRRRIEERIEWRLDPSAWGQQPPSETTRLITAIEAWADGETTIVRSGLIIQEQRRGFQQILIGHQIHELVGAEMRRRTKIIVIPQLEDGVRNPSFVL